MLHFLTLMLLITMQIYLMPDRKRKLETRVHRKTLNPTFNETFKFEVLYSNMLFRKNSANIN